MSESESEENPGNARPETEGDSTLSEDEGEVLEWTCHPVKRRPIVSVAVTSFLIVLVVLIYSVTGSPAFALLAMVIMLASLAKFYFPTAYRLSDKRIMIKTTTQTLYKNWSVYRSCYPDKKGILLSPFAAPSRLENFRGLFIMFNDNGKVVTEFVRSRIGGQAATSRGNVPGQSNPSAGEREQTA